MVLEPSRFLMGVRRTRSADGTLIAYHSTDAASADTPVVLLAGGLGGHHRAWSPLVGYFGDRLRFIAWDYRGLFGSASPVGSTPDAFGMERHLDDLVAVLDAERVDRLILVGWSMGVQVSVEAYRRLTGRVRCMVLLNGMAGRPLDRLGALPGLGKLAQSLIGLAAHGGPLWSGLLRDPSSRRMLAHALPRLGIVADSVDAELFERLVADLADINLTAYTRILLAMANHDATGALPLVDVPTLVVTGDRDPFTPVALAHSMARRLPRSEIHVVRGGGHYLCLEFPDLVNLHMEHFFERLGVC
jgi:pimeloyl-ACP methyl ester carboxylesterase